MLPYTYAIGEEELVERYHSLAEEYAEDPYIQWKEDISSIIQQRYQRIAERLFPNERDWRFGPHDGGDPTLVSEFAMRRELDILRQARRHQALLQEQSRGTAFSTPEECPIQLQAEISRIKYFPVLFISTPHIEENINGTFPGIPTPLLYATAVLDRYLRIDEFPCYRVPEVKAVMNPPFYGEAFIQQLTEYILTYHPRVVGISNLSEGHYFALQIVRQIKALSADTIIIMGGSHEDGTNPEVYYRAANRVRTSAYTTLKGVPRPDSHLYNLSELQLQRISQLRTLSTEEEQSLVDFVAAGDCPYLVFEFMKLVADHVTASCEQLKKIILSRKEQFAQVEGSGYLFFYDQEQQRIQHIQLSGTPLERNKLPYISLEHLTRENRFPVFNGKLTAQVMACTGCKYKCTFCYESADQVLYEVPKLQQRTPENVIKELDLLREQGFEAIFFDDSTFTQNLPVVNRLLDLMLQRKEQYGDYLEWGCQTTINDVNPDLLKKMSEAGCSYIYFGFESASPDATEVQKASRLRVLTGETNWQARFRRTAEWCCKFNIRVGTSVQFGLRETAEQRRATLLFLAQLYEEGYIAKNCIALNVNTPYPGTDEWLELMKQDSYALPDYREKLNRHPGFETAHQYSMLTPETANELYALATNLLGDAIIGV
jgi:hypothetical protein